MHRHLVLILAVVLVATLAKAAEQAPPPAPATTPAPANPQAAPLPHSPAAPARAEPQPQPPPRTITVTGRAIGYVPKDTVIWTIGLEATGKDVSDTKKAGDLQVKAVTDTCTARGILPADIDPGLIRLVDTRLQNEKSDAADSKRPMLATRSVTVRQRDVLKFNDLLEALSHDKSNRIRYVFVCSKRDEVMRETITLATQAAREKAAAMATVAGAQLGRPLTIDEYSPPKLNIPDASVPVDRDTPAFGVDTEKIIMTVYATFELQ
jgi:uncharacterized protein YggE